MEHTGKIIISNPGYSDTQVRVYDTTSNIIVKRVSKNASVVVYDGPADRFFKGLQLVSDYADLTKNWRK